VSEQTMTPEAAMLLLDAFTMECPTVTGKASLKAIRAAVAELAQERDEFRKDRDEWKEYCARVSEGKEAAETERDALRRRVEELEEQKKAADIECKYQMGKAWASLEANKVLQDLVDRKNDVLKTLLDTGRLLDVHECLVAKALSWKST